MKEYLEMDEQLCQLSYLYETMSAIEDAMINGDVVVSGEAWLIPLSELHRISNKMNELLESCVEQEREQQKVWTR